MQSTNEVKKDEVRNRRSYFSPLDGFPLRHTSKDQGLSNNQIGDEGLQDRQNSQFRKRKQGQHKPCGDAYLPSQDDQEL